MRRIRLGLIAALVLPCGGCFVVSKHPIAAEDSPDVTFEPALLGDYLGRAPGSGWSLLRIARKAPGATAYVVSSYGSDEFRWNAGRAEPLNAPGSSSELRFVRIGGRLYTSAPSAVQGETVWLLLRFEARPSGLVVSGLNAAWFRDHPGALACDVGPGRHPFVTLTAASDGLRAFLARHGDDPALWWKTTYVRPRQPAG